MPIGMATAYFISFSFITIAGTLVIWAYGQIGENKFIADPQSNKLAQVDVETLEIDNCTTNMASLDSHSTHTCGKKTIQNTQTKIPKQPIALFLIIFAIIVIIYGIGLLDEPSNLSNILINIDAGINMIILFFIFAFNCKLIHGIVFQLVLHQVANHYQINIPQNAASVPLPLQLFDRTAQQ